MNTGIDPDKLVVSGDYICINYCFLFSNKYLVALLFSLRFYMFSDGSLILARFVSEM